jgi:hypothetical protein
MNYEQEKLNAYTSNQAQGPYTDAIRSARQGTLGGGANTRQATTTDQSLQETMGRLNQLVGLVERVERTADRLGAPQSKETGGTPSSAQEPQPDTLIWRLAAINKTMHALEARLSSAVQAIESVV